MPKLPRTKLERLVEEVIYPFYQVERATPLHFAPGRHENDAEHSWSLALFACALSPHVDRTLDMGKICQFSVVHDLVEVYAGDTSNLASEAEKSTKEVREQEALQRLQQECKTFPWITETIVEYEAQNTAEARFVKSVDKLLSLLFDIIDKGLCYKENKVSREAWQSLLQKHRAKAASHAGVFEYYDEVWNYLLDNPQFFHQEQK